jgi:hypothetical protein
MIQKKILNPKRVRRIDGGFSFIPHRFLTDGFAALIEKGLIAFDGTLFQVLELPAKAPKVKQTGPKDLIDLVKQTVKGV